MINLIKKRKNTIFIALILILAGLTRLWMLGQMPLSLSDDEIREGYSAYSIFQTGKDAYGNLLPLVISIEGYTFGPLPIYFSSLMFVFMPLTMFAVRFPYALAGIFSVLMLYFIGKKMIGNSIASFLAALVMIFSSWDLQVSRVAHDAGIALVFYLIAINLFLRIKKNNVLLTLLTSVTFFIAFYCYVATRIIFLPVILSLIWYKYKDLTKRQIIIVLFFAVTALSSFGILSITQNAAQYTGGQFFFQDSNKSSLAVELERRASPSPQFLKEAYHNKITYWFNVFVERYSYIFSPEYLFTNGEANGINSLSNRGELYALEAPLIILGILYLFAKRRREFFLAILFLLIAPLPSGLGGAGATYVTRSVFFIPWIYLFIGAGIYSITYFVRNKKLAMSILVVILIFYLYAIGSYFTQYYFSYKYYGAKYFSKSTQDLVQKINQYQKQGKSIIVSGAAQNTFLHYAFYNQLNPKLVQENISKTPIKFANFSFYKSCLNEIPQDITYIAVVDCKYLATPSAIIKEYAGSESIWNIYEK